MKEGIRGAGGEKGGGEGKTTAQWSRDYQHRKEGEELCKKQFNIARLQDEYLSQLTIATA